MKRQSCPPFRCLIDSLASRFVLVRSELERGSCPAKDTGQREASMGPSSSFSTGETNVHGIGTQETQAQRKHSIRREYPDVIRKENKRSDNHELCLIMLQKFDGIPLKQAPGETVPRGGPTSAGGRGNRESRTRVDVPQRAQDMVRSSPPALSLLGSLRHSANTKSYAASGAN